MSQQVYIVRPAIFAPMVLSIGVIAHAFQQTWWSLAALPFIWLGSVCAQPNMNLADGCLAYVSMLIGFGITLLCKPLGIAMIAGAASGYYASVIEKSLRMLPASDS